MSVIYAALLGIVQGIAEFLPISSSGHLVIVGALLSRYTGAELPSESATMNVALHCGTLVAILIVYRRDLWELRRDHRLIAQVLLATVPVGAVGLLFKDQIESLFNAPLYAGFALLVTGGMLLVSRRLQRPQSQTRPVTWGAAIVIGTFQAFAIIPGISRSGSTIAAALMCGLSRAEATRFSFLIAVPAIGGATMVKCRDFLKSTPAEPTDVTAIVVGTVISLVVGIFALQWLIRIVVADRLHWFAFYCGAVGIATICWQLFA
jgi:undecaprenyl-diphosphatase